MTYAVNLKPWKVTLAVDAAGGYTGKAVELTNLKADMFPISGKYATMIVIEPDGSIRLAVPVEGARTSTSTRYPRCEFRQMLPDGSDEYEWDLELGGSMTQVCAVLDLPRLSKGTQRRAIVGQVHSLDNGELCRVYYDYSDGTGVIRFANDMALRADGTKGEVMTTLRDADGNATSIPLGADFAYTIDVDKTEVRVTVGYAGKTYTAATPILPYWLAHVFYFKCGAYAAIGSTLSGAVNQATSGWTVVRFRGLNAPQHDDGVDEPVLPDNPTPTNPATPDPTLVRIADGLERIADAFDDMLDDEGRIRIVVSGTVDVNFGGKL